VSATAGFSVALPADTFAHSDSQAQVAVTASSADGAKLPDWVSFSASDKKFTGVPPAGVKTLEVVVTARDSSGNQVSTKLTINFD
jgi:phage-related protein